jgi:hypothetical protein
VRQGKPGVRGRTDYQVIAAGKRLLKDGWRALIEDGSSSWLCWGGDRRLAPDFLRQSADMKEASLVAVESISDPGNCPLCLGGTAIYDPQSRIGNEFTCRKIQRGYPLAKAKCVVRRLTLKVNPGSRILAITSLCGA